MVALRTRIAAQLRSTRFGDVLWNDRPEDTGHGICIWRWGLAAAHVSEEEIFLDQEIEFPKGLARR